MCHRWGAATRPDRRNPPGSVRHDRPRAANPQPRADAEILAARRQEHGYEEENTVAFLQEIFRRFGGDLDPLRIQGVAGGLWCRGTLDQAIEHAVEATNPQLRALSGYGRQLKEPVAKALNYIEDLVDQVPGAISCSRSTFGQDPRVNAFFVNAQHVQEVFSQNPEVREFFDTHLEAEECWALLCMRRAERRQFGMALVEDTLRGDVLQTTVSFTDHLVVSPGADEEAARCSLKSRVFNGLLAYIQKEANAARATSLDLETRLRSLRARLKHAAEKSSETAAEDSPRVRIAELEQALANQNLRLTSLEDYLAFAVRVLGNPAQYLSSYTCSVRLSRLGIKLDDQDREAGYEVPLSEIRIADQKPRVGALVRFSREELLPRRDLIERASFFLML